MAKQETPTREELERSANDGDVGSMVELGLLLVTEGSPSSRAAARVWWEEAAKAGDRGAIHNLGCLALEADPPDVSAAKSWFEQSAAVGDTDSLVELGFIALEREAPPNIGSARSWFERAAEAGDYQAMVYLGRLFADYFRPPDLDGAKSWWERAAAAGVTEAMRYLGNLAYNSEPPDLDVANTWYEKAATAGDTEAMISMGFMCLENQDAGGEDAARGWWEKAAKAGSRAAMSNLGQLALRSQPPDFAVARAWYEQAAEAGDLIAMRQLGTIAMQDMEGADAVNDARRWWEKAAAKGDVVSMSSLGGLFAAKCCPPDLDLAQSWWEKAADAGDTDAMYNLGVLLSSMTDTPDLTSARGWLEKAVDAGSEDAAELLKQIAEPTPRAVSDMLRRSSLGQGWYVIRNEDDSVAVYRALIGAGACAVQHGGMFNSTTMAIGFPGGCFYEVVSSYGFGGLQEGVWIFGPTAVRQVFRLLGYKQPKRRLSGEAQIPTLAELEASWEQFVGQDRLQRVALSLGALVWMRLPWLDYGRDTNPDQFQPLPLPIQWSKANPPPGEWSVTDPRYGDGMFWRAESTIVWDATGRYRLSPDGEMTPDSG